MNCLRYPLVRPCSITLTVLTLSLSVAQGESRSLEQVSPSRLKLVGGYRVGWYNTYKNKFVAKSSGFPYGGMAAHTFDDGTFRVWHENGEAGRQVIESSTTRQMGKGADPTKWPLLDEADGWDKVWSKSELYGDRADSQFVTPYGLAFDPDGLRLWVSARSTYATGPDSQQWLAAVDYPSREVNAVRPNLKGLSQQMYGGGLGIIPKDFADAHLGGRRLGFISGGYESGQRASMGPSLAATYLELGRQGEAIQLMHYLTTSEVGETPFAVGHSGVAESFPDYRSDMSWHYPVTDGVGYWPGSSIRGNGAWISTPDGDFVLYMSVRGAGEQTYAAQVEGGGAPRKNSLYVYDAEVFAQVAAGERGALGIPRDFYEYYEWNADNNGGINSLARALSFDAGSGLLWVYYPGVWRGDVERHPIVAAYEFVTETAFVPGDFDRNGQVDARDFVVWRASNGQTVNPGEGADANWDGVVDVADYIEWRQALVPPKALPLSRQTQEESRSLLVPEPNAICSAIALAALLVCRSSSR